MSNIDTTDFGDIRIALYQQGGRQRCNAHGKSIRYPVQQSQKQPDKHAHRAFNARVTKR